MKKIIQQLKRQGLKVTHSKSVYTAHLAPRQNAKVQVTTNESIDLVFTVGVQAHLAVKEIWQKGNQSSKVLLSLGAESRVDYRIDGAKYVSPNIDYRAYLNRGSTINFYSYLKTNQALTGQFIFRHQKPGSEARINLGLNLSGNSQTKLMVLNHHRSQKTTGDIVIKCLAQDRVNATIDGLIKIEPQAKFTDSYLTENVLLLSGQAEVRAVPNLEILNNEVKASHSASLGRVDDEMIYYLMSRGLSKLKAEQVLIKSFFKDIWQYVKV